MKYLYFDIECCDGRNMCSFGYVIVDDLFNVLEKKDIIINPEKPFRLGKTESKPNITLAYPYDLFAKHPNFQHYYKQIKTLLEDNDYTLLGHGISSDIQYLKEACERYGLPLLKLQVYDTQNIYYNYNKKYKSRSLENIVQDLAIDTKNLVGHKSCDDAEMSMLTVKELCKMLNLSITDLLVLCSTSLEDGLQKPPSNKKLSKIIATKLKYIAEQYPNRHDWDAICISDTFKETSIDARVDLFEKIFQCGYNYTSMVSKCKYFVVGNTPGIRDASCEYNIRENNQDITIITIAELADMLHTQINENAEIIEDNTPRGYQTLNLSLKNSLLKKGISYEEFLASLN